MKAIYSTQAKRNLLGISDDITDTFGDSKAASSQAAMVVKEVSRLKESPYLGTPVSFEFTEIVGDRAIRCKNFGALYRICENNVYIDRVLYLKRDHLRLFEK